jgi:hypothetical protein
MMSDCQWFHNGQEESQVRLSTKKQVKTAPFFFLARSKQH